MKRVPRQSAAVVAVGGVADTADAVVAAVDAEVMVAVADGAAIVVEIVATAVIAGKRANPF